MAATGTPTPNLGLRIPQGTDPASVDDINYNSNLLDTKLGAVGETSVQDQIDSLNSNIATLQKKAWTLLKEQSTDARNYDQTVTINGKFSDYNELLFMIQTVSNSRVIATVHVPYFVFNGGGVYCCGSDTLGITAFYNAVFIYATDTTVEIATNLPSSTPNATIKCRIYGR